MVVVGAASLRLRSMTLLVRIALTVAAILLVYRADRLFEDYRDVIAFNSSMTSGFWRWVLGAALIVVAGAVVGMAMRSELPGRQFDALRVVVVVAVPLLLALTFPMVSVWHWPLGRLGTWLRSVQFRFADWPLTMVMWFIVGLGIASGFRETGES